MFYVLKRRNATPIPHMCLYVRVCYVYSLLSLCDCVVVAVGVSRVMDM